MSTLELSPFWTPPDILEKTTDLDLVASVFIGDESVAESGEPAPDCYF